MLRWLISSSFLALLAVSAAAAEPVQRVDESALRYYASLGQKDRVAAETQRLQKIDPSWHQPDDLFATKPGRPDEQPLWTLYTEDRMADLAAAIALRQATEPGWEPSEDLKAKVRVKTLRANIMLLGKAHDWRAILRNFKTTGIAWAKDDAEALWVIAEAYAREDNSNEAYVVYRLIIADHRDPDERRATIEHAIAFLPMALTEKLIAMGGKDAAGRSEFEPIAIDITRARISAFLHDEPANEVTSDELKRFEDNVRGEANPNEPGLVAWYDFKRHEYPQALDWFKLAIGHGGDAMVAHGLAHTLRQLGMKREAEEVAYAWREPLVNNSILFIDLLEEDLTRERPPAIEAARLTRYAQVAAVTQSGEGAQALAWYAYNTCQYPLALQWFEHAMAWLPKEATAYGYALALQRLRRGKDFRDVVNRYDGLFPKVVSLAFDDGIRRPPPPCEVHARQPTLVRRDTTEFAVPTNGIGRTMADTLRPQAVTPRDPRSAATAPARVPSPDALTAGVTATTTLKKKTEFPFAVPPENGLRFSALRTAATGHEILNRQPQAWSLVARRVPGVGAMPYEIFGFKLLPGWDGTTEASSPTAAERSAPVGTLWALEQYLRGNDTTALPALGADSLSRRPLAKVSADTTAHLDRRT